MEDSIFNLVDSSSSDNSSQQLSPSVGEATPREYPTTSPFQYLFRIISQNTQNSNSNLPGNGINPFAGDGGIELQKLIFDRLQLILGDESNNPFTGGSNPFVIGDSPIGNGNRNFGNSNATIGNFNSDFGSDNATIGNGNWNFNTNNTTVGNGNWLFGSSNTTIGNGNWYLDSGNNNATLGNGNWHYGSDNTTIGNGNWYLDSGNNNATLGNGNWYFGTDNTTIGNGNWDFGTNNTILGNGNWIFTNNNTVVGNGNWLIDSDNTNIGFGNNFENSDFFVQGTRDGIDNIINSVVGRIGQDFIGLTGNLEIEETQTFNRLILARDNGTDNNSLSSNIEQLVNLLSSIPINQSPYEPVPNPQSVPEPTYSLSLIVVGFVCLLLSKFKKVLEIR